jgi:hypothetical protein
MKYFSIITLAFLIVFSSCQKKNIAKPKKTLSYEWIEISAGNQTITVYHDYDTASVANRVYKLVSKQAFMGSYKLEKIERTHFKITSKEKDSLCSYVSKAITQPSFPKTSSTDFVGNVSLKIKDVGITLSCDYNAVSDWKTVTPETKKIYQLLSQKVKL